MRDLIKQVFKYTDEELESGAIVKEAKVTIDFGKVSKMENCKIAIDDVTFTCSAFNCGLDGELVYNINSVPARINGLLYAEEFLHKIIPSE